MEVWAAWHVRKQCEDVEVRVLVLRCKIEGEVRERSAECQKSRTLPVLLLELVCEMFDQPCIRVLSSQSACHRQLP